MGRLGDGKRNILFGWPLAFCVTLVKKETAAFSGLQNYRVQQLPVVLIQSRSIQVYSVEA